MTTRFQTTVRELMNVPHMFVTNGASETYSVDGFGTMWRVDNNETYDTLYINPDEPVSVSATTGCAYLTTYYENDDYDPDDEDSDEPEFKEREEELVLYFEVRRPICAADLATSVKAAPVLGEKPAQQDEACNAPAGLMVVRGM